MTTVYIKGHALPYESDIDYFTLFNRLGSGGAESPGDLSLGLQA